MIDAERPLKCTSNVNNTTFIGSTSNPRRVQKDNTRTNSPLDFCVCLCFQTIQPVHDYNNSTTWSTFAFEMLSHLITSFMFAFTASHHIRKQHLRLTHNAFMFISYMLTTIQSQPSGYKTDECICELLHVIWLCVFWCGGTVFKNSCPN